MPTCLRWWCRQHDLHSAVSPLNGGHPHPSPLLLSAWHPATCSSQRWPESLTCLYSAKRTLQGGKRKAVIRKKFCKKTNWSCPGDTEKAAEEKTEDEWWWCHKRHTIVQRMGAGGYVFWHRYCWQVCNNLTQKKKSRAHQVLRQS